MNRSAGGDLLLDNSGSYGSVVNHVGENKLGKLCKNSLFFLKALETVKKINIYIHIGRADATECKRQKGQK